MGLFSGKKLATMFVSWAASMIPALQELPIELTAGIIAIIFMTRAEDITGVSLVEPIKKGVMPARLKRNPVNSQAGVRQPRQKVQWETEEEYDAEDEDSALAA